MQESYAKQRNSIKNKNFIMFHGSNAGLYDNGSCIKVQSASFQQGDKIKMRVNPVEGFIQWSIDGTIITKYKS